MYSLLEEYFLLCILEISAHRPPKMTVLFRKNKKNSSTRIHFQQGSELDFQGVSATAVESYSGWKAEPGPPKVSLIARISLLSISHGSTVGRSTLRAQAEETTGVCRNYWILEASRSCSLWEGCLSRARAALQF